MHKQPRIPNCYSAQMCNKLMQNCDATKHDWITYVRVGGLGVRGADWGGAGCFCLHTSQSEVAVDSTSMLPFITCMDVILFCHDPFIPFWGHGEGPGVYTSCLWSKAGQYVSIWVFCNFDVP